MRSGDEQDKHASAARLGGRPGEQEEGGGPARHELTWAKKGEACLMLLKCAACPPSCSRVTSAVLPLPTWEGVAREVKLVCMGGQGGGERGGVRSIRPPASGLGQHTPIQRGPGVAGLAAPPWPPFHPSPAPVTHFPAPDSLAHQAGACSPPEPHSPAQAPSCRHPSPTQAAACGLVRGEAAHGSWRHRRQDVKHQMLRPVGCEHP